VTPRPHHKMANSVMAVSQNYAVGGSHTLVFAGTVCRPQRWRGHPGRKISLLSTNGMPFIRPPDVFIGVKRVLS